MTLKKLIDFSSVDSRQKVFNQFVDLSSYLFRNCELHAYQRKYRIAEVELALHIHGLIEDGIHLSTLQTNPMQFYVHRTGKAFKRKQVCGVDLTCGGVTNEGEIYYGTLLIRSLQNIVTNEYIEGPALSFKELVSKDLSTDDNKWNEDELKEINKMDASSSETGDYKIIEKTKEFPSSLYIGSRVSIPRAERDELFGLELPLRALSFEAKKQKRSYSLHQENTQVEEYDYFNDELVTLEDETSSKVVNKSKQVVNDNFSIFVPTNDEIIKFRNLYNLSIGGELFNSSSLRALRSKSDLDSIGSGQQGCYFIFSNIPENEIPTFSDDGYKAYKPCIHLDGVEYRCLYNGKGQKVKERLYQHLFNAHTLDKIKSKDFKNKTLSGTGALSLTAITKELAIELEKRGIYNPSKQRLKPVDKRIRPGSPDSFKDKFVFLNGIDITESPWINYSFAVVVIKTDSEFGKILIEEAFASQNGRPPLCGRHG
ncbi:MAG: hypothetical protein KC493_09280 [Bacteriovoracaceae bacterium]|nr:hypothetical protein [Bacteriovoracaceae bacterium]